MLKINHMKKEYRVIEVVDHGKLYYEIQYKDFLFWNTETELQVCTDGMAWEESFKFYEREKAIDYVNNMAHNERSIIFELSPKSKKGEIRSEFKKLHRKNFWIHFVLLILVIGAYILKIVHEQ